MIEDSSIIMVSYNIFKQLCLSFPEVNEEPHFEKVSFRVDKKIMATYDAKLNRACIKLSAIDQDVFSMIDSSIIYPVDNKWGKQGWTLIELGQVRKTILKDAISKAYNEVASKKLIEQWKNRTKNT